MPRPTAPIPLLVIAVVSLTSVITAVVGDGGSRSVMWAIVSLSATSLTAASWLLWKGSGQ
jgi:hypothetical protein